MLRLVKIGRLSQCFTLIELILVMVIVGILSAVTIPKFFSATSYNSNFLFYEVLNSVRYARKLAVVTGCHIQVEIASNQLTLTRRTGSTCSDTSAAFSVSIRDPVGGGSSYVRASPGLGITLSSTVGSFYFNGLGQARNSSTNAINSVQMTVGSRVLQVIGETGFSYEL